MKKLEYYGVKGVALSLFESYLSNRKQSTCLNDTISLLELIEWGVSQGSVVGPLLFLIFINDSPRASDLGTWLFADDTALLAAAASLAELQYIINTEVDKIQTWLLANKLSVHYVKKSQYMLVNKNINRPIVDANFELVMGGHVIARTKTYKYLGLTLDDRFSWVDHITEVCSKLSQVAGIIFRVRNLVSKEALMLLYHGLVGSKLRYGLICWATANKFLLDKVNVAHNKIITYMTYSKRCVRMWPLYCDLKVLPLDILIKIEYGKTIFKFNKGLLPVNFDNYFVKPSHQHRTRYATLNENFEVIEIASSSDKSRLKYIGPKIWIAVPLHIKQSMSLKVFAKSFRNHLIGNYIST